MPDIEKFTPAEIWSNRLFQRLAVSPLHTATELRWMPASEQLPFRAAIAKSMSRPDFTQLAARTTLGESIRQVTTGGGITGRPTTVTIQGATLTGNSVGNPNLRPTTAASADVTAEWYFAKAGPLTFAAFNKDLKDIVVNQMFSYDAKDAAGNARSFTGTGPTNGAHGYARGFELAYQRSD